MTKANGNARHMRQTTNNARGIKGRVVALALAGVLAVGGVGAYCIAGVGKSPGQAPATTQMAPAQTTVKNATTKKNDTKQATTNSNTKPATQQAQQKPAPKPAPQQQQTAKPAPKPAPQQATAKPAPKPAPKPAQQKPAMTTQSSNDGMEVKVSREGAIAMACKHVGANGQAQNVKTSNLITGGGTKYYEVEFDHNGAHYSVSVNVVDGNVISAERSANGTRQLLNEAGKPQPGTEQPAEQPAPKPEQQPTATAQSSNDGMEAKVSREGAIAMACEHVGANGQAQNVTARGPITGGGTIYYEVEFDFNGTHYSVSVDAVGGSVISAEQSANGTRQLLNENGEPQPGTEQPAEE